MATLADDLVQLIVDYYGDTGEGGTTPAQIKNLGDIKRSTIFPSGTESILIYLPRPARYTPLNDRFCDVDHEFKIRITTPTSDTRLKEISDEVRRIIYGNSITGVHHQEVSDENDITDRRSPVRHIMDFTVRMLRQMVSRGVAYDGGVAGSAFLDKPFVTYDTDADLTSERVLDLSADNTLEATLKFKTDGTYDIGENATRVRVLYADDIQLTNPLADAEVADDITLTNITQITNRAMDDLQAPDATVDCGTQILDNVAAIQNGAAIKLTPNDDTDDYLELSTGTNIPQIKCIGSSAFVLTTDGGTIQLKPSNDTDDYLEFYTSSDIPRIKIIGGQKLYLESDDGSGCSLRIAQTAYFDFKAAAANTQIFSSAVMYIDTYSGSICLRPSNDTGDYIAFHTDTNLPHIDAIGACGMVLASDGTHAIEIAADATVTMKTDVTFEGTTSGVTVDAYDDLTSKGSGNSVWYPCIPSVEANLQDVAVETDAGLSNDSSTDFVLYYYCPLPCVKGSYKLYITGTRVVLYDADAAAYVDATELGGRQSSGYTAENTDATNYTAQGDNDDTFTAVDCSGYDQMVVKLTVVVDAQYELDIAGVLVQAYYDT